MNEEQLFTVSELVKQLKRLTELSFPRVSIEGEVSSLAAPNSGHLYFSLKDEGGQIRCAMFRQQAARNRFKFKEGDLVKVSAKVSVYPQRGELQCIVQRVDAAGEGLLKRQFDLLKAKLDSEGLFNQAHKLAPPAFPKRIGIITSATGAAVQDVLTTLSRRCPGIPVRIFPSLVQGADAAISLRNTLETAVQDQSCDVLILCRGGGSVEDLWAFNDENLIRSIHASPIPIISGVGHETDVTLCDLVADVRAATPTAAAELISPDMKTFAKQLAQLNDSLCRSIRFAIENRQQTVDLSFQRLTHPAERLAIQKSRLENLALQLNQITKQNLERKRFQLMANDPLARKSQLEKTVSSARLNLANFANSLYRETHRTLELHQRKIAVSAEKLQLVNPLNTLARGYAVARNKNGELLRSVKATSISDNISVQLADGNLNCEVTSVE